MAAILSDALRQAFMPKREYESLREEEKAWHKLQRPLLLISLSILTVSVFVSTVISLNIVFSSDPLSRPFCSDLRIQPLPINFTAAAVEDSSTSTGESQAGDAGSWDSDRFGGAFSLTDQETVDYYWMVVFIPSALVFTLSIVYLVAGIIVAYTAPARHGCLKVVENNYCASRRGGVRCLSILNMMFAIIFGLLALFLGSTLLTLGSSCSVPLFWCYEISSWGLVILHGGTAFFLRRKAASILDESDYNVVHNNMGIEMLEANPVVQFTPEVERRVNQGFKAWMGPSLLSSDDDDDDNDDDDDGYQEVSALTSSASWQRH